ncbi:MAG TPA: hypothetical protein VFW74_09830 [Acidimicrobiia bacterium]|nr:hypothetical protein [Acidimicrobiia bacterium]
MAPRLTRTRARPASPRRSPVRRVASVVSQLVAAAVMLVAYLAVVSSGRFLP